MKKSSLLSQIEKHYPFSKLGGLPRKVREAFIYMEDNFNKKIGLKDVAKDVNLKPASLCQMIHEVLKKKEIDITCSQYIDGLKVMNAIEQFKKNPSVKCYTVANSLGICDRNLRKIFTKFTGKSPSEYRNDIFTPI
jgi:two-component system response regulator YesN